MFSSIKLKLPKFNIDWVMIFSTIPLLAAGLMTMNSLTGQSYHFNRQLVWLLLAFLVFFICAAIDWRFLRRSGFVLMIYLFGVASLFMLFLFGEVTRRTFSWFALGGVSFQPAEMVKLFLIIILAKYFTRRHIEISQIKHIILSGFYAFVPFVLIFLQPDLGSAMIVFFIWLGLTMVSGISLKHLLLVFLIGTLAFGGLWLFVLHDYQKQRIVSFLNPMEDIRGSGYNAFQSMLAVGSGQIFGKSLGFGSQSRLKFLPEYQTDFIFAAFAEEWGFLGVVLVFLLFGIIIWRILANAKLGTTNFEMLFGVGLAIMLMSHFIIHVGMNIGFLPITGLPMPFLSYGGSHLLTTFAGLGILTGMRKYSLAFHREDVNNEFVGPQ